MIELNFAFSSRDNLPDDLFSMPSSSPVLSSSIDYFDSAGLGAVLGYPSTSPEHTYTSPYLVILPHVKSFELLSWLKTYATETFPLSQFGRVIGTTDYHLLKNSAKTKGTLWRRPDRWPSVVLGEMLAHSYDDTSVSSIPLSRATATYSFSVARASIAHRSDLVTQECIKRLDALSSDHRFVERWIDVNSLRPIWDKVGMSWIDGVGAEQILKHSHLSGEDLFPQSPLVAQTTGLMSDSVEGRVIAFKYFSKIWLNHQNTASPEANEQPGLEIALAAFLVGRGTSHVFLLKDLAKRFPSVYVWFGLIAGLCGPTYWDPAWARAAKSIEKMLKSSFCWEEMSPCDISWAEYLWLDSLDNEKIIQDLPKLLPKVLSMEVLPGVVCQFRLKSAGTMQSAESSVGEAKSTIRSVESELLYKFVNDFIKIADPSKLAGGHVVPASTSDSNFKSKRGGSKGGRK